MLSTKIRYYFISLVLFALSFSNISVADSVADVSFKPLKNYCASQGGEHNCTQLPQNTEPKTVIVIHGLNSSMGLGAGSKIYSNYVRLLRFLTDLGVNQTNYHVYGIDFNSSGVLTGDQPIRLVAPSFSDTCDAQHKWENCWRTVEEGTKKFNPFTITIRDISQEIKQLLIKATNDGFIEKASYDTDGRMNNPVTIVSHSMGALIARDLLYVGESQKSGYELLLEKGIWINEYVSLGAPHNHGFFGITNEDLKAITEESDCLELQPFFEKTSFTAHQYCAAEEWIKSVNEGNNRWQNGQMLSISKVDFPQIHWVFVAALGERLPLDEAIGDGVVDWQSAQYQLFPGDETPRADNRVYLDEYLDSGNYLPLFDINIHVSAIPGQRGMAAQDGGILPYSGFVENSNVDHSALINVGYYFGGDIQNIDDLKKCSSTGNMDSGIRSCVGYFQYVIPATTLCKLSGYNKNSDYFKKNPQFYPHQGMLNFDKKCSLKGVI